MKNLIFLTSIIFCSINIYATDVGGTYDENTIWSLAGSPYNFTDNVIIKGATLTIEPGVVVNMNGHYINIQSTYGSGAYYQT